MQLWTKNLQSIFVHFWILVLGALLVMIPELKEYISQYANPELVSLGSMFIAIIIKKIINENK